MSSHSSLNHIYRTVWNQALGAMVAVAEISRGHTRSVSAGAGGAVAVGAGGFGLKVFAASVALAWSAMPLVAEANPVGGVAVVGQATYAATGNQLLVTTQNGAGTSHSAINWQSFSIPLGSGTFFQQPTAASTSINRVVTNTPSQLFGTLGSNGNLVLVNQSGITVGAGAVVDTAGFTASALRMTDADALAGRLRFGDGTAPAGDVSVLGQVLARSGDVVVLGANVATGKDAVIQASNGSTILAAGQQVELTGRGLEGITLQVQAPADSAVNLGTLKGDAVGVFAGTLKHSGLIQATTATLEGGKVVLKASGDAFVEGAGKIIATGTKGGAVDVLGNRVAVMDQAAIDVSGTFAGGTVRIGGDYQGNDASVPNAQVTYFGARASVKADATGSGNGGKVIVWADDTARAYGAISARGGSQNGDGGFVETSGKIHLEATRAPDISAPNGKGGHWLLDPSDLTVVAGAAAPVNLTGTSIFNTTANSTPSQISVDTINTALGLGNVEISTAAFGGKITFDGDPSTGALLIKPASPTTSSTFTATAGANGIEIRGGSATFGGNVTFESNAGYGLNVYLNPSAGNNVFIDSTANLTFRGYAGGTLVAAIQSQTNDTQRWDNRGKVNLEGDSLINLKAGGVRTGFKNNSDVVNPSLNINTTNTWSFLSDSTNQDGRIDNGSVINVNVNTSWEARFNQTSTGTLNVLAGKVLSMQNPDAIAGTVTLGAGAYLNPSERHATANPSFAGATINGPGRLDVNSTGNSASDISLVGAILGDGVTITKSFSDLLTIPNTTTIAASGANFYSAGALVVDKAISSTGDIKLIAGWNGSAVSPLATVSGKNLTVNGAVTADGAVEILASGSFSTPGAGIAGARVAIETAGDLTVGGSIHATNNVFPALKLAAGGTLALGSGANVHGTEVSIILQGNLINIDPAAAINAGGSGDVWLQPRADNRPVNIVADIKPTPGSSLDLSKAELSRVTAGTLHVGSGSAGQLTVGAPISLSTVGTIALETGNSAIAINDAVSNTRPGGGKVSISTNSYLGSPNPAAAITGSGLITARYIDLQPNSAGAIGSSGSPLNTSANQSPAGAGVTGFAIGPGLPTATPSSVYINHIGEANLTSVKLGVDAPLSFTATGYDFSTTHYDGNIVVNSAINTGSGSLTLTSADGSLTLNGDLTSSTTLQATAAKDVIQNANILYSGVSSPSITVSGGSIHMGILGAGNVVKTQTTTGTISYTSTVGEVAVGLLDTGVGGSVQVSARTDILDNNNTALNIKSGSIALMAGLAGYAGSVSLDTQASSLSVTNSSATTASIVSIRNTGSAVGASVYSSDTTSQLTITNDNTINVGHIGGATNTTLTAVGTASDITVEEIHLPSNSTTLLSAGDMVLNAGRDILVTHDHIEAGGSVTATAGRNIRVSTGTTQNDFAYIRAASDIVLTATTGGLYLDQASPSTADITSSDGDIKVVTGNGFKNGNFTGFGGSVSAPNGRWLIYAPDPGSVNKGDLNPTLYLYNTPSNGGTVAASESGFIYASPLYVDANFSGILSSTFGVNPTATLGYNLRGLDTGDTSTAATVSSRSVSFSNWPITAATNAGSYPLQFSGSSATLPFSLTAGTSQTYTVNPATITVRNVTAGLTGLVSKVYDGNDLASLVPSNFVLSGFVSGDSATVSKTTGIYTGKNVGTGLAVTTTLASSDFRAVGSTNFANYILPTSASGNVGVITPASISAVTGITATGKEYDAKLDAALNSASAAFTGKKGTDVLTVATSVGAFEDKNAGTGKTVNITGLSLGGVDAKNYTLVSTTATTTADITKASISAVTGITAAGKEYEAKTTAMLNTANAAFTGEIIGDVLTVATSTGAFADKNAGVGKTVNITGLSLGGADAQNYTLAKDSATTTADITKATISAVTGITAAGKEYDAKTSAMLNTANAAFTGEISGDVLTVKTSVGAFADKNAGTGKTVNIIGLSLDGADAKNYTLAKDTATTTADITKASISAVTGITAAGKAYDAKTTAVLNSANAAFTGEISGDVLTVAASVGTFADKNAGVGKTVNITGLSLGGTDAQNYTLAKTTGTTAADITKANISAVTGITAAGKEYDAKTAAVLTTATAAFAGEITGDVLTVATAVGAFVDKNAGAAKIVNITGLSLGGADAQNYTLATTTATATASISKANISAVTGIIAAGKEYDAKTTAVLTTTNAAFAGSISGDALTVATSVGAFADKNAGVGKTVNITGLSLGGADAQNYTLTSITGTAKADITAKALAAGGITAANKIYDGKLDATLNTANLVLTGVVAGDSVTTADVKGAFADKNAGVGKTVNITSLSLDGTDAKNYTVAKDMVTVTADITKAEISAVTEVTAANKPYDAKTDATLITANAVFAGKISGDALTVATSVGAFEDKNAGTDKKVKITGLSLGGDDAKNYTLLSTTGTTKANISKADISAVTEVTATNKPYDAKTDATLNTANAVFAGKISGDALTVATSVGAFEDKNAGTDKKVNITGLSLGGDDAKNYTLVSTTGTTKADVAPKALTVGGITGANKVYDGKLDAPLVTSGIVLTGLVAGDSVTTANVKGAFVDKNVGTSKQVNLSGLTLAGTDARNYTLTVQSTTSADITVRPTSTWSGAAGTNNWNDAGNWDALPDGANVLAVNIGNIGSGSGTVAFDSGSVSLQNLSSAQTLAIGGGTLQVSGALTTSGFSQSAGTVTGGGSFTASGAFNQSGGNIDMASIAATQSSGNITVNSLKAASVNLTGGSISETLAGGIETTTLTTQSTGGTVLTGPGNKIGTWNAFNTGSGELRLTNTGLITVTAINDGGDFNIDSFGGVVTKGQVKTSGAISITANSPLTVGVAGLSAGGNIVLRATNLTSAGNIVLDGPVESAKGSVTLKAASNLTQNSSVRAPLGVSASADGILTLGPLATSGFQPVSYVVASKPVTSPPPPGALSTVSDIVVALMSGTSAIETPAAQQAQAAANVPMKDKDKEKDTTKEALVSEGGICRP